MLVIKNSLDNQKIEKLKTKIQKYFEPTSTGIRVVSNPDPRLVNNAF